MEAAPTFPLQGWRSGEPSKDKGSGSGHLFLSLSGLQEDSTKPSVSSVKFCCTIFLPLLSLLGAE